MNDPDTALTEDGFTQKCGPDTLSKIKTLKTFPCALDALVHDLGIKDTYIDSKGKTIERLSLMGQIQPIGKSEPIHCVFQWSFLPGTDVCYHRCATEKIPRDMIDEYHARQFNVDFPPLPTTTDQQGSF